MTMTVYPMPEYDRPETPEADAWFWTVGDLWSAVVADHERPTWWGLGDDDDPPPDCKWELPIAEFPPTGHRIQFRLADGRTVLGTVEA